MPSQNTSISIELGNVVSIWKRRCDSVRLYFVTFKFTKDQFGSLTTQNPWQQKQKKIKQLSMGGWLSIEIGWCVLTISEFPYWTQGGLALVISVSVSEAWTKCNVTGCMGACRACVVKGYLHRTWSHTDSMLIAHFTTIIHDTW